MALFVPFSSSRRKFCSPGPGSRSGVSILEDLEVVVGVRGCRAIPGRRRPPAPMVMREPKPAGFPGLGDVHVRGSVLHRSRENGEIPRDAIASAGGLRSVKIVHVTLRFDAPGGVETTVREVTRRLKSQGVDVEVFASDLLDESGWVRGTEFRSEVDGVPVRRFPVLKRPFPRAEAPLAAGRSGAISLPLMVGLVDALRESGADVIHVHSHRYGHVLQAAAVSRRTGTPLVASTHYHPADRRESAIKRGLLRCEDVAFGWTAYRIARALVAESELEARLVRGFAPRDRIRVIPPGIDLDAWANPATDRTDDLALPERYLVYAGRIASNKGLSVLLDALAHLPASERIPLVMMGPDWGERSALEARARSLGIDRDVRWLGMVLDPAKYRGVIRHARALVLPSEWEAYGLVLLDALAAGTPVVATAAGGIPEVIDQGRAGRLVPYGDPAALSTALRATWQDPEGTHALVRHGSDWVRAHDWSMTVRRHLELYRELVAH